MIYKGMDLVYNTKEHIVKTLRNRIDKRFKEKNIPREKTFDKDLAEIKKIYKKDSHYKIKKPTWEELEIDNKLNFLFKNKNRILSNEPTSNICKKIIECGTI
jgi:hypothetical protein